MSYLSGSKPDFRDLWERVSEESIPAVSEELSVHFKIKSGAQTYTVYLLGMLCSVLPVLFHTAPGNRVSRLFLNILKDN